jgi:hypothetical protein
LIEHLRSLGALAFVATLPFEANSDAATEPPQTILSGDISKTWKEISSFVREFMNSNAQTLALKRDENGIKFRSGRTAASEHHSLATTSQTTTPRNLPLGHILRPNGNRN